MLCFDILSHDVLLSFKLIYVVKAPSWDMQYKLAKGINVIASSICFPVTLIPMQISIKEIILSCLTNFAF